MKMNRHVPLAVLFCVLAFASGVCASGPAEKNPPKESNVAPVVHNNDSDAMRVQGEQRFRANCGRCHSSPRKFPPRVMSTVLRHMRVRATITDEDTRMILFYMTQ